jgi:hypothetical protein
MAETRRLLAVFLIGLLVGVAATTAVSLGFQQSLSVSVPSVSVDSDCGPAGDETGWAAQVPNRGHQTVLLNRSITGPVANSTLDGEMDFRLSIMTAGSQEGCHYEAAVTLPDTFGSLTVVHDGREVFRLQNEGTGSTRFWRLNESAP